MERAPFRSQKGSGSMPRVSHLSIDNILRFLQVRNDPVSLEDLSHSLRLEKNDRRALLQMLEKLKKRGLVEELTHGRFLFRQSSKPPASNEKRKQAPAAEPVDKFSQHKAT